MARSNLGRDLGLSKKQVRFDRMFDRFRFKKRLSCDFIISYPDLLLTRPASSKRDLGTRLVISVNVQLLKPIEH